MNNDKKVPGDNDSEISATERQLIDESFEKDMDGDDSVLEQAELDHTDEDGELLNEESSADDISGNDLDIPGSEDDDADENIGEEDEENNGYSQADTE